MATRSEIETQYQADLREAEAYKATNDLEKYNDLRVSAADRRANSLDALAREGELSTARVEALQKYPDADPEAVYGANAAEMEARAKKSHDFIADRAKKAVDEDRKTRRQAAAAAFGGAQVPRTEILGQGQTAERTAAQVQREKEEAQARGDTATVLRLMREQGKLTGLDYAQREAVREAAESREE